VNPQIVDIIVSQTLPPALRSASLAAAVVEYADLHQSKTPSPDTETFHSQNEYRVWARMGDPTIAGSPSLFGLGAAFYGWQVILCP
jgi:hypothetical protein